MILGAASKSFGEVGGHMGSTHVIEKPNQGHEDMGTTYVFEKSAQWESDWPMEITEDLFRKAVLQGCYSKVVLRGRPPKASG